MQARDPKPGSGILNRIALVICVFLVPLIIANVTIIVGSYLHPDEIPGFLGYKPFIVLSDSMMSVISAGDLVITKEVDTEELKEGDVIAFREGKSVITHRIVSVIEDAGARRFVTRGDNNNANDPVLVKAESVEGRQVLIVPSLGNAALFLQTPVGMTVIVALPLILFIFYESGRRKKIDAERQERTAELERELDRMRQQNIESEADKREPK